MSRETEQILQGWKDIATYISRDVRTARRWEKLRGLPVRRNAGGGRANIYALPAELDLWLGRSATGIGPQTGIPTGTLPEASENGRKDAPVAVSNLYGALSRRWAAGALAMLLVAASALAMRMVRRPPPGRSTVKASTTSNGMPYPSRVSGVTELYLRGLYLNDRRTSQGFQLALPVLLEATAKDPGYAPAWVALANTYISLHQFDVLAMPDAFPQARAAAMRALALDPKLSRAHTSAAVIDALWLLDIPGSEREFHEALALDPNDAFTHHWHGALLLMEGFLPQALEELDLAQRLQPGVTNVLITRAYAFGLSGHRDQALAQLEDIARLDPAAIAAQSHMALLCLFVPRNIPCYLEHQRRFAELSHNTEIVQGTGRDAVVFRSSGEAVMWAEAIQEETARPHPNSYDIARLEAIAGRKDEALENLQRIMQQRNPRLSTLNTDPLFEPLHMDPRFRQIEASLGLPAVP